MGYSQMRRVLTGIFEIGGCEVNGYVDKEYYFNQYEWLKEVYPRSMQELAEQYGITDPSILAGIEDAIFTEFFDAGRIHMCAIDAATTSIVKSQLIWAKHWLSAVLI